jgi:hypothetical protein
MVHLILCKRVPNLGAGVVTRLRLMVVWIAVIVMKMIGSKENVQVVKAASQISLIVMRVSLNSMKGVDVTAGLMKIATKQI